MPFHFKAHSCFSSENRNTSHRQGHKAWSHQIFHQAITPAVKRKTKKYIFWTMQRPFIRCSLFDWILIKSASTALAGRSRLVLFLREKTSKVTKMHWKHDTDTDFFSRARAPINFQHFRTFSRKFEVDCNDAKQSFVFAAQTPWVRTGLEERRTGCTMRVSCAMGVRQGCVAVSILPVPLHLRTLLRRSPLRLPAP